MQKLLNGIYTFRQEVRAGYLQKFAHLALGQSPDCLFFACSDSRVVPNLFASTDPGDLFVVRNPGNIIPPCHADGSSSGDLSEAAAVEFAVDMLGVGDVVVCGHSSCGAMRAVLGPQADLLPNLRTWLSALEASKQELDARPDLAPLLPLEDRLSQAHVVQQIKHLHTYPTIRRRVEEGRLRVHGWWFELAHAEVHAWSPAAGQFSPLVPGLVSPSLTSPAQLPPLGQR